MSIGSTSGAGGWCSIRATPATSPNGSPTMRCSCAARSREIVTGRASSKCATMRSGRGERSSPSDRTTVLPTPSHSRPTTARSTSSIRKTATLRNSCATTWPRAKRSRSRQTRTTTSRRPSSIRVRTRSRPPHSSATALPGARSIRNTAQILRRLAACTRATSKSTAPAPTASCGSSLSTRTMLPKVITPTIGRPGRRRSSSLRTPN